VSPQNVNYSYLKTLTAGINFDTIYIHGIYSLWFSIMPILFAKQNKANKIIVATHGMLGKHARSIKSVKKQLFLNVARFLGLYKNVFFHAANESEANDVFQVFGRDLNVVIAEEMPMNTKVSEWQSRPKKKGGTSASFGGTHCT